MAGKKKEHKEQKEQKKEGKEQQTHVHEKIPQPILLEMAQTIWRILIILSGLATTVISYLSGCGVVTSAIRGGIAILTIGILAWLMNWFLIQHSLETVRTQLQKATEEDRASTIDKAA